MQTLRTDDSRFSALPGYAFAPHYIADLPGYAPARVHYVDEAPELPARGVALCLHGQPTWSYLYRKMVPAFLQAGYRVVAPDLFGFGRSDKPVAESDYSFTFHRAMLLAFISHLGLRDITLVCQDWGGLLGLTLPMDLHGAVTQLLVMNTMLGTGDEPLSDGFLAWRAFSNARPDMDIAALMRRSVPGLSREEAACYAAPFPDASYKAGVRRFPNLVPDSAQAEGAALSRQARHWWTNEWKGRSFMAIGMQDPVLGAPAMRRLHGQIRFCPPPLELECAGHFTQEAGAFIVAAALAHFAAVAP